MNSFDQMRRRLLVTGAAGAFAGLAGAPRLARAVAAYPDKPVRIVLPYLTSGPNGIATRILADGLARQWGQSVIVDSRPGANGSIGAMAVKDAHADGYTLLSGAMFVVLNPLIDPQARYKTEDFIPVASFGAPPNVIVVNHDAPWQTLDDLIRDGKRKPGKLSSPHAGIGSSVHLGLSLFLQQTGIDAVVVPYKGSPPYVTDLLGGRLDFAFLSVQLALPQVQAGRLRVLATVSERRLPELQAVPTLGEAGYAEAVVTPWSGLFAAAGTPASVLEVLTRSARKALADPDIQQRYRQMYAELPIDPLGFPKQVNAEEVRWKQIVASRSIKDLV